MSQNLTLEETKHQSLSAMAQWGEQWKEHAKINGERYKKDGRSLKDLLNDGMGKLCVIAATGASLEKDIPTLLKYRDKFDLCCNDKSFQILMDHGIKPEYVILADANVKFNDWCKDHIEQTESIHLISNITANPEWQQNWKGPVTWFVNKDNIQTEKIFSGISGCNEILPAASNVGNTAVVIMTQLCLYDQYLLTGYDFCWSEGNYYAEHDSTKRHWMRHLTVINNKGEFVHSSGNLHFSSRWLADYLQTQTKRPVYNCSDETILFWRNSNLEKRILSFNPRTPTDQEWENFFNSRMETVQVNADQFRTPKELIELFNKFQNVFGIKIDYLRPGTKPDPSEVFG